MVVTDCHFAKAPTSMSKQLHLPNLDTHPPRLPGHEGGWCYQVPETGQVFCGSSLSELMINLAAHYKAAGYPQPPNLARLVEDYICDHIPDYCGGEPRASRADDGVRQSWLAGLKHTFTNVLTGTQTLAAWIVGGRHYVDGDLANERARICTSGFHGRKCPENEEPLGCTGCNTKTLHEIVRSVVGSRTTTSDSRLKACKVCGCDLKAKVHLPHDVLWKHMADAQIAALPPHCWLLNEGEWQEPPSTQTTLSGGVTVINAPPLT